ncbi:MAG: tRNA pseudouridine(13) synthase TruD [Arcobacteraceae bacterium]
MQTQRIFLQTHEPLNFTFKQTKDDFIVDEITNVTFKGKGNYLVLKIKKQSLSTWELLSIISETLGIEEHKIGYAGLKDKNATTTQYISIPINRSKEYKLLNSKNIKVLGTYIHDQKLKIGDLEGNRFRITLQDIDPISLGVIYQSISHIEKHGMPNYFGFQRFGKESNFEKSKRISYGEEILKEKKLEKFMKLAYQSYFFNGWLAKRVELSKDANSKKLLPLEGDVFKLNDRTIITGLLPGRNIIRAKDEARLIEEEFDDMFIYDKGYRRDAWIRPSNIKNKYNKEQNSMQIEFVLPKSSYATVFIENIANKNFTY